MYRKPGCSVPGTPWVRVTYVQRNANVQWRRCASDGTEKKNERNREKKRKERQRAPVARREGGGKGGDTEWQNTADGSRGQRTDKGAKTQKGHPPKWQGHNVDRHGKWGGRWARNSPERNGGGSNQRSSRGKAAQDGQARMPQANPEYGRSRSNLDQPLKEAIEGEALSFGGSRFHTLGAMDFIDLLSE